MPILLTRKQVAALFQLTERAIQNLDYDGTLRPIKIRGAVRYKRAEVLAAIDRLAGGGSDPTDG